MEWSTKKEAQAIADKVIAKQGKHSICALARSIGYRLDKQDNGNIFVTRKSDPRYKSHDKELGVTKQSDLIYFLVINGHDFTEVLLEDDPSYGRFFETIKTHTTSGLDEVSIPVNRR